MLKQIRFLMIIFVIGFFTKTFCKESYTIKSPDKKISVNFQLTSSAEPVYSIFFSDTAILEQSKLGILRSDEDFSSGLTLDSVSGVTTVSENYKLLHGKRLNCSYTGNRRVFYLKSKNSKAMEIIFQVSNDGVAFRYYFPGKTDTTLEIYKELTSYHFDPSAKAFLQPCADARMGWSYASPSYEEYYKMDIPVGTPSPNRAG